MIYNENGVIVDNNIMSLMEAEIQQDLYDYIHEQEVFKNIYEKGRKAAKFVKERILQFIEYMCNKLNSLSEFLQSKVRSIIPKLNEKRIRENYALMKHTDPKAIVKDNSYQNEEQFTQILLKEMPLYALSFSALILITSNEGNDKTYFDRFNKAADEICLYMANNSTAGHDLEDNIDDILYKGDSVTIDEIIKGKNFFSRNFTPKRVDLNIARKSIEDVKKINLDTVINKVKDVDKFIPDIKATNRQLGRMRNEVNKFDKENNLTNKSGYNYEYDDTGKIKRVDEEDYNSLYNCIAKIQNFGSGLITYIKQCMNCRLTFLMCLSSPRLTRWLKSAA